MNRQDALALANKAKQQQAARRRAVALRMKAAGHSNASIAHYLHISTASAARYAREAAGGAR